MEDILKKYHWDKYVQASKNFEDLALISWKLNMEI